MKKLLALVLVLIMVISLTACGDDSTFDDVGGTVSNVETPVSSEEEVQVDLGGVEGSSYKNASVGIQLVAPEGWTFYTQDQIDEMNNENTDLEAANAMFDMMIIDASGNNVSVSFENLGKLYGSVLSEDKYLELAKQNIENSDTVFENIEITTVTVAGETWGCLKFAQQYEGITVNQMSAVKKCGKFMALVTATGIDKTPEEILAMFTKI